MPFVAGAPLPKFVHVEVTAMGSPVLFASVLPGVGASLSLSGSAVAGPKPVGQICNALPMALCGTPGDSNCTDGSCFGLGSVPGAEIEIKSPSTKLGPGNYGLVDAGCPGAACVRENMAGGGNFCFSPGGSVTTEPGAAAGPTAQGLNTRFGIYQGPVSAAEFPPDLVTNQGPLVTYAAYRLQLASGAWNEPDGVAQRRVAAAPVVQCDPPINGKSAAPVIGSVCLFLRRSVDGANGTVYGEIVPNCLAQGGGAPPVGGGGSGPAEIVLYQDIGG
jgi:hypothetical protein